MSLALAVRGCPAETGSGYFILSCDRATGRNKQSRNASSPLASVDPMSFPSVGIVGVD